MAKKKKKQSTDEPVFEESLLELEQIVRDLEEGKLGLNDALKRYEDGVACLRQCHQTLQHVEQRIELLTRIGADGDARAEPFEDGESVDLEEKQHSRSRRRSSEGPRDDMDGPAGLF